MAEAYEIPVKKIWQNLKNWAPRFLEELRENTNIKGRDLNLFFVRDSNAEPKALETNTIISNNNGEGWAGVIFS